MWTRLRALVARLALPRCEYCRALVADPAPHGRYAYCSDACRVADWEDAALRS